MIHLEGFIAKILVWLFLFISYSTFFIGAWVIINNFIWNILIKNACGHLKVYKRIIEFMWHRKEFYRWIKKNKETE